MTIRWFSLSALALVFSALALQAEVLAITQENFSALVEQSDKPVIIDIYAPWCPPCRKMGPIFDQASLRHPNIRFVKIDFEAQSDLVKRFEVQQLPTLLFLLPGDGNPVMSSTGLLTGEELDAKIDQFQNMSH